MSISLLLLFSILSNATYASGSNSTSFCDDILEKVMVFSRSSEIVHQQEVCVQFHKCGHPIICDVITALQDLEFMYTNYTVDKQTLTSMYDKYRFNELFLLKYLEIIKQNTEYADPEVMFAVRVSFNLPRYRCAINAATSARLNADDELGANEKALIRLSWAMFQVYHRGHGTFDGYQILYRFLWRHCESLPSLRSVYDTKKNQSHLRDMQQRYNFIIWHHKTFVNRRQSIVEMYVTGLNWIARRRRPNRTLLNEYMLQLLTREPTADFKQTDQDDRNDFADIFYDSLIRLASSAQWSQVHLLFSGLQRLDGVFVLRRKYCHFIREAVTVLNLTQAVEFIDVSLRYVASEFNQKEHDIVA
eukprot:940291_1